MGTFSSIKKYSKPSLELDERISYLNSQLVKTGMLSERMTTDALYQQGEYVPERGTDHTSFFADAPEYISGGSKLLSTQSFTSNDFATIRRQFPSYTSRAGWKWIYISNVFRASWGNNINSFGETGGIGGYYTSMPDARLIAGGSVIRTSDPVAGYTTRYHPNNYPSTAPLQANLDDPDYLPILSRTGDNIKGTNPWTKVQDMLNAGIEYFDTKFGKTSATDMVFRVFATMAASVNLDGAANMLREYGLFTNGKVSYTPEKPKMTLTSTEEKAKVLKAADNILSLGYDPKAPGYKPPTTEKQKEKIRLEIAKAISQSMNEPKTFNTENLYYQHGSVFNTFHKNSTTREGISPDGKGGLNVNDGYDFAPKEGQTGTENARVPGPSGPVLELLANAVTADARSKGGKYAPDDTTKTDGKYKGKGASSPKRRTSIVDLPRMPIRTTFTKEDLKGTSIGMLLKDLERPTKVQKELNSWDKAIKYLKGA